MQRLPATTPVACHPAATPSSPSLATAEETQQCADAATEHVRFLEEKAETDRTEAEAAAAALQAQLEGVQVGWSRLTVAALQMGRFRL